MLPCWDVDYGPEDRLCNFSCQGHLAKQDQGRSILSSLFSKFEKKSRQILQANPDPGREEPVGLFDQQPPQDNAGSGDEQDEQDADTRHMQELLQNLVNGLGLEHERDRSNQLSLLYESLAEPTRNEFGVRIVETGEQRRMVQIPELVQNFSSDFWIRKIKKKVLDGETISDEDLIYLLLIRLKFADVRRRGFVLEDLPKNPKQKRILDSHNVIPHLVFLIDGVGQSAQASVASNFKQLGYLRLLRDSLQTRDFGQIRERALAPVEDPIQVKPSESDAEISDDEDDDQKSAVNVYRRLLSEALSDHLAESLSLYRSKAKRLDMLASIVSSKLLLKNRFELLTVLYSYKEHYDNVRVLNCNKDPLFNLLVVKKSIRCMVSKLVEVFSYESQTKGYRVSGLGLSRSNILKNLTFVDNQFICALEYVTQGKRELLECSRDNMVVVGNVILPVRSDRIERIVEK